MTQTKSHYDTLGVPKDASPAEIKSARKRRARQSHPDFNPNKAEAEEEIRAINHAADVLLDPERRLLYDQTGEDNRKPAESEAGNVLLQFFQDAIQKDAAHCLNHARNLLLQSRNKQAADQMQAESFKAKLVKKQGKIKFKKKATAEQNLFESLLDQQIKQCDGAISQAKWRLEVLDKVAEMLDQYTSSEKVEAGFLTVGQISYSSGSSSTFR